MTTSKQTPASKPNYNSLPTEIEGFDSLAELALDLRWSWNHATDEVWRKLDPALWELTQNPWVVLQTVSKDKLKSVLADSTFRKNIDELLQTKRQAAETPAWFQQKPSAVTIEVRRVFQHGIYVERSAADLLRRAGQRGR